MPPVEKMAEIAINERRRMRAIVFLPSGGFYYKL
jgi:hypothetical protein